ncbi:MAG: ABC transporter, substrate-binding protein (cluster 5, nickel/peptides/opines) [uncultured Acetobacteraceae bacterium]|uniref:ABC transporter, substrate-binding protein (Cluster 5, nickel/peptides/opines) n=1 Tax=uncultured Acetobacteraceae bacterium TaxID=169975 RepID=A0A6J4H3W0_9PROT|nr:MAG: ABC transporter, substrate-binding protein (cluster 5, nickel/peptides/opines) [uncultured Acetobacteraceae bacterium]
MRAFRRSLAAAALAAVLPAGATPAAAQQQPSKVLRIAMTASDVPTTSGMPNNGFEGMRFLGYPVFEPLVGWDLSRTDGLAGLKPALAESWEQDAADPRKWRFTLRSGVLFHDGTPLTADAVVWNLDRFFKNDSPQFDPAGSAIVRGRIPVLAAYRKLDDRTVELETSRPVSYWPYLVTYILITSPQSFEQAGRDWSRAAALPPAGTGPFRLTRFVPRQQAELSRNDAYWNAEGRAKLDRVLLLPMPEANTRLAALRSNQVDWIEVPPPDAVQSLRGAGFQITTGSYPHVWPWVFAAGKQGSPTADPKVRQALNYCIDRDGMVALLNGTAEPSVGFFKANDPNFGEPQNRYRLDPARGRALLAEAGFTAQRPLRLKIGISTSGSGQMLPLPMNEFLQQSLRENCGVEIAFEVVEWNTLLAGLRAEPTQPQWLGADALNISLYSSDPSAVARWFLSSNATPRGSNAGHWRDERFDAALGALETERDPARIASLLRTAHERLVDNPPWLWIVHDLNPRAMSRRVRGFVSPQSWFVDLARVDMQ